MLICSSFWISDKAEKMRLLFNPTSLVHLKQFLHFRCNTHHVPHRSQKGSESQDIVDKYNQYLNMHEELLDDGELFHHTRGKKNHFVVSKRNWYRMGTPLMLCLQLGVITIPLLTKAIRKVTCLFSREIEFFSSTLSLLEDSNSP